MIAQPDRHFQFLSFYWLLEKYFSIVLFPVSDQWLFQIIWLWFVSLYFCFDRTFFQWCRVVLSTIYRTQFLHDRGHVELRLQCIHVKPTNRKDSWNLSDSTLVHDWRQQLSIFLRVKSRPDKERHLQVQASLFYSWKTWWTWKARKECEVWSGQQRQYRKMVCCISQKGSTCSEIHPPWRDKRPLFPYYWFCSYDILHCMVPCRQSRCDKTSDRPSKTLTQPPSKIVGWSIRVYLRRRVQQR